MEDKKLMITNMYITKQGKLYIFAINLKSLNVHKVFKPPSTYTFYYSFHISYIPFLLNQKHLNVFPYLAVQSKFIFE